MIAGSRFRFQDVFNPHSDPDAGLPSGGDPIGISIRVNRGAGFNSIEQVDWEAQTWTMAGTSPAEDGVLFG